ncbi:MAG TPA: hypothetical protein HPP94_01750 [Desulfuromonadales bacterium]|nr:hypothetical protein [Desulfuromonadales bacterium]
MKKVRSFFAPESFNNPDDLLRAIIWIAGFSVAIILALSTAAVYQITSHEVIRDSQDAAVRVSWAMFEQQRKLLTSVSADGSYQIKIDPTRVSVIDGYFRTYLRNFNILKIKIYTPEQQIIYSTDTKIIGETDGANPGLKRALGGSVDSHMEKKDRMLDLSDETKFGVAVVETYVPLMVGERVIGVFELYSDVTTYRYQTIRVVALTLGSLAIILFVVFACSYLVIRKTVQLLKETQQDLADKVIQREEAVAHVKQLEGIIPICMHCKKIRDDQKSWQQLEQYISNHSEARFSHGICPECYEKEIRKLEEREP